MARTPDPALDAWCDAIIGFIVSFKAKNAGHSPSLREIGRFAKIGSTSHVTFLLNRMERAGKIKRVRGMARSITVIAPAVEDYSI